MFTEKTTLEEAKVMLWDGVKGGTRCPCCNRWAQSYWRTINKTMARGLWWLANVGAVEPSEYLQPLNYVDITKGPAWLLRSNQLATLRWWKLVERMPNDDPSKKHSGMWRVTTLGVKFLSGDSSVPRRVCTLFGNVVAVSDYDDWIDAHDIKHHFDYSEVMGK
jgi:hypothetical protein